jgi:hypothetical protein
MSDKIAADLGRATIMFPRGRTPADEHEGVKCLTWDIK